MHEISTANLISVAIIEISDSDSNSDNDNDKSIDGENISLESVTQDLNVSKAKRKLTFVNVFYKCFICFSFPPTHRLQMNKLTTRWK